MYENGTRLRNEKHTLALLLISIPDPPTLLTKRRFMTVTKFMSKRKLRRRTEPYVLGDDLLCAIGEVQADEIG